MKVGLLSFLFLSLVSCGGDEPGNGNKTGNGGGNGVLNSTIKSPIEQRLYCYAGSDCYNLYPRLNQSVTVVQRDCSSGNELSRDEGSYSIKNGKLTLSFPSIGFQETTTDLEAAFGLVTRMWTPSLYCYMTGHNKGQLYNHYVRCPDIKHVPGAGYEKNAFEFFADGRVKRRRWKEITGDTLYKEFYGSYYLNQNNKLFMVFGEKNTGDGFYFTGQVNGSNVTINELEPSAGACK